MTTDLFSPLRGAAARLRVALLPLVAMAVLAGGCEEKNTFVPPPPPKVTVAKPERQSVIPRRSTPSSWWRGWRATWKDCTSRTAPTSARATFCSPSSRSSIRRSWRRRRHRYRRSRRRCSTPRPNTSATRGSTSRRRRQRPTSTTGVSSGIRQRRRLPMRWHRLTSPTSISATPR